MCISTGPAHFSKTKILTMKNFFGTRHFTAYQNDAENISNLPNALILPIPGLTKPEWFINTSAYSNFLEEIVEKNKPRTRSKSLSFAADSFEKFELGQYTIGLTSSYDGMVNFINSSDVSKRPSISKELLNFFATHYEGWSFAICLFSSTAKMKSQPIAYEYEPLFPDVLFYPTMDAHTGGAPMENNEVMDHDIITAYPMGNNDSEADYFSQNVPYFIKNNFYDVFQFHNCYLGNSNGDVYVNNKNVLNKSFDFPKTFKALTNQTMN